MTEPSTTAATERISDVIAAAQRHQNDVEKLMALHTESVSIINIAGRRIFGRPAFTAAMTQALTSALRDVPTTVEVDRIEMLTDDVAIASCTKTVHDQREGDDNTPLPASVGRLTYVLAREGDDWLIASAQTTPVAG